MNKYIKYIGINFDDFDCYHLTKKIYKEVYNLDILDTNVKHYESDLINKSYMEEASNWIKVDINEAREGDIVALRFDPNFSKIVTHFAIMINNTQIIHTTERTGSIVENVSKYYKLIDGFYRHKKLIK